MKKTNESIIETFQITGKNQSVNTLFKNNKTYLTKKEIARLFDTKKIVIKSIIKNEIVKSSFNDSDIIKVYNKRKDKKEAFYSLDIIISIGYRLKSYDKTKFLINSSLMIKKYNSERIHNPKQKDNKSNIISNFLSYLNGFTQLN